MQAFAFPHDHSSCLAFSAADTHLAKQANTMMPSSSGFLSVAPCLASKKNNHLTPTLDSPGGPWPGGLSVVSSEEGAQKANSSTGVSGFGASAAYSISKLC